MDLDMAIGKIWRILRKNLKFLPYRPTLPRSSLQQTWSQGWLHPTFSSLSLRNSWRKFSGVMRSGSFCTKQAPNRKNDIVWGPAKTRNVVACKKAHQAKVMAWVGIVDGKVLPVQWFDGSVNSNKYLSMLKTMVWPAVRGRSSRNQ